MLGNTTLFVALQSWTTFYASPYLFLLARVKSWRSIKNEKMIIISVGWWWIIFTRACDTKVLSVHELWVFVCYLSLFYYCEAGLLWNRWWSCCVPSQPWGSSRGQAAFCSPAAAILSLHITVSEVAWRILLSLRPYLQTSETLTMWLLDYLWPMPFSGSSLNYCTLCIVDDLVHQHFKVLTNY